MKFGIVIEKTENNFSAYVPDLPGCIATGTTKQEVLTEIIDAIKFHVDGLKEDGEEIPKQKSYLNMLKLKNITL
ncbi:MAG: type II toxin-antitoxin system HicB family antitoxin [Candidatus Caenarcaniphilales bacterium]|nr:type II toxin-antitoxin system HicB family antitoxin [Candidatus Caenarcaniphilales bacterium]